MNFLSLATGPTIGQDDISQIAQPIIDICSAVLPVLLAVVGAVGAIWCIVLGVKLAKADDPQEHEKAKKGLRNAIIGFVVIFVLLIALRVALAIFVKWYNNYKFPEIDY